MTANPSSGGSYRYNPTTDSVERVDAPAKPPEPAPEPVKAAPKAVTKPVPLPEPINPDTKP